MSTTETKTGDSVLIVTSVQRRRRYAAHEKHAIVMETLRTGQSVSAVVRRHAVAPSQLYQWRKQIEEGARIGVSADEGVVSKSEYKKLQERTRRLERLLGMKTEEVECLKEAVRIGREKKSYLACAIARNRRFRISVVARALGVSRSNLYAQAAVATPESSYVEANGQPKSKDESLVAEIRGILGVRPTYGYRRITAILRQKKTFSANHKKVYRVMKAANLLLQRHTGKVQRTHEGKVITLRSNTRWCTDAFGIQCWNGEQLQVAFSINCCDREVISWVTSSRGIDGELVRDLMTETLENRFPGARADVRPRFNG